MKCLILFFNLLSVMIQIATSRTITSSGQLAAITCINDLNLEGYSQKIATFITQDKAPINDTKLNKFMQCYWTRKGLLDQNGNIDTDHLQTYLEEIFADGGIPTKADKITADKAVEYCKDTRVKNPGQKAIIVQNCITAFLMDQETQSR